MPADNLYANNRPEILKQLDDFNTADMSGGILQGILEEQLEEQGEREDRFDRSTERQDDGGRERLSPDRTEAPEPVDHYAPLNTSIQQLASQQERSYSQMQDELAAMRQQQADERRQYQQQNQYQQQQQNVDYEAPVTYAQHARLEQAHNEVRGYLGQQHAASQYQRAQNEYLMYKLNNPDYSLTPAEFNTAYKRFVGNDPGKAATVDWAGVHSKTHMDQRQPRMQADIERLTKENEDLKKRLDGGGSGGARKPAGRQDARPVSPALRPAGRAVSSPLSADGDSVVNLPSFAKGRSFKTYGRELQRGGYLS